LKLSTQAQENPKESVPVVYDNIQSLEFGWHW